MIAWGKRNVPLLNMALCLISFVLFIYISVDSHQAHARDEKQINLILRNAAADHAALCVFRGDLAQRAAATESYLKTHPGDILGVPRATVVASLHNQQSTLESLSLLKCKENP